MVTEFIILVLSEVFDTLDHKSITDIKLHGMDDIALV